MSAARLLREQHRQAHEFLDSAIADVIEEQAHWQPAGLANPLGATYAHLLFGEDAFIAGLGGRTPLFADGWQGRTGVSEPPPLAEPGSVAGLRQDWHGWGRSVRVELPALRSYAQAVREATDEYLASLSDADLDQVIDLSAFGLGEQSLAWILSEGVVGHVRSHWGEIACLKGLQGSRGLPL
jgi:hypothetical protein